MEVAVNHTAMKTQKSTIKVITNEQEEEGVPLLMGYSPDQMHGIMHMCSFISISM